MKILEVECYESPWEAYIALGRLKAEGVSGYIFNDHHIGIDWPLSLALGWVKLKVAPEDKENALEVVKNLKSGKYLEDLEFHFDTNFKDTCQQCGSENIIHKLSVGERVICFMLVIFSVTFPVHRNTHLCKNCGSKCAD